MFQLRTGATLAMLAVLPFCASCGGNSESTTDITASGQEVTAKQSKPTRISTGVPTDRRVMVSKSAKSLYAFEKEPKGGEPVCYGKCAKEWPPYLASGELVGIGPVRVNTALLGTVKRRGGSLQVTFAGHPLYEYAHEGMTESRGFMRDEFGGSWYLIAPDGALLTRSSSGRTVKKGGSVVSTGEVSGLGTVLVDARGHTLYDFHMDKGAPTSTCYGICTDVWPPLLTEGKPQARGAVKQGLLGTTKREDGLIQVTYAGHPLYTYMNDKAPGENHGEDPRVPEAEWYGWALRPDGKEADPRDPRIQPSKSPN